MNIDYKGMSVTNRTDYMKIHRIMSEPELELGQVFDIGLIEETESPEIDMKECINDMLELLTERECKIVKHRFGIDGHKELQLKEVGEMEGVSRERVRQIEAKALRKLRHPTRSSHLRGFLDD